MNLIIYYLTVGASLYFCLPMIGDITEDPLMQKLIFFASALILHYVFYLVSNFIIRKKKSFSEITDKSFLGGLSLLFGLLIYYDLDDTEVVLKMFPQITEFYPTKWFSISSIMSPLIILSFFRILFSPP